MYIVYLHNIKHSAWNTEQEAKKQLKVLKNCGYKEIYIRYIENFIRVNGYYFI